LPLLALILASAALLALTPAASAAVTRLTFTPEGASCASWSPDSQRIAFVGFPGPAGGPGELRVVNRDGSGLVTLASNVDAGASSCPSWAPDGTKIAFTAFGVDNNQEIFLVNSDGTGLTNFSDDPAADAQAEFSPDGSKLLFLSCRNDSNCSGDLFVMPVAGGAATRLTTDPGVDVEGTWSPDGSKIAFTSSRSDPSGDVFVMNADGSGQTRVTTGPGYDHVPAWLPDGRILYVTDASGGVPRLHIMEGDGSNDATLLTQHVESSVNRSADYSVFADGTKVTFTGYGPSGSEGIFVANLDGSGLANLSNDPSGDVTPAGAPDGSAIAFRSMRDNPNGDLYLTDPTVSDDADGDGVPDAIDADGGAGTSTAGSFSDDTGNGKTTTGSIINANGLSVTVEDVADPKGVRITATGAGSAPAVLSLCPAGFELEVPAGASVVVTCGSVSVSDVTGHAVKIRLPGGLTTVVIPVGSAATVDTTAVAQGYSLTNVTGSLTLTVDGVTRTVTAGQEVFGRSWHFAGFDQPVDNNGVLNQLKAGQVVPLKWRVLTAAGTPVTTLTAAKVMADTYNCATSAPVDSVEQFAVGGSGLQNLGNGYYQFNWATSKAYAGSCKKMRLEIGDGVTHDALFKFTK
jgi:Tol biopolymer transport system component